MAKRKAKRPARVVTRRYDLHLKDTAPTTELEKAAYRGLGPEEQVSWCPIREQQLDAIVCSRLQVDHRPRCRRVNCGNLDSDAARTLRRARAAARQECKNDA